jgi:uncharacterized DUF497 family protein
MPFEFDPDKDTANITKHGLSLAEAWMVYEAPNKITVESKRAGEVRRVDIALVEVVGVVLVLVYIQRGPVIRAISLRRASRQERKRYEAAQQN